MSDYCHLSKVLVVQGQDLRRGDLIGEVGDTGRSTGPHLHWSVWKNGRAIDPSSMVSTPETRDGSKILKRRPITVNARPLWMGVFCLFFSLLSSCSHSPRAPVTADPFPAASSTPRLLIVSSLIGYVEPCGCTIDLHLGGLARLSGTIERERAKGPTAVVFLGPYLFEKDVKAHRIPQEESKARLIGRCLQKLGIDGVVHTKNELIRGKEFLHDAFGDAIPDVTANTTNGTPRIIKLGDMRLGVFGLVPEGDVTPSGTASGPREAADRAVQSLREQGADVIVSLASLPRRELRKIAKDVSGVDLWVLEITQKKKRPHIHFLQAISSRRVTVDETLDRLFSSTGHRKAP